MPTGDYSAEGCFNCHRSVELELHSMHTHGSDPRITCIECHPPHQPLRVALPSPLIPSNERSTWQASYDWYTSNSDCLSCHAPAQLMLQQREGFVTVNAQNYHDVHVIRGRVMCIECHIPHGASRDAMLRSSLLTSETLAFFGTVDGGSCAVNCHGVQHDSWKYVNRLF